MKSKCKSNSISEIKTTPNGLPPANRYDDGNIPDVDLPSGEDVVTPIEPLLAPDRPINKSIGED